MLFPDICAGYKVSIGKLFGGLEESQLRLMMSTMADQRRYCRYDNDDSYAGVFWSASAANSYDYSNLQQQQHHPQPMQQQQQQQVYVPHANVGDALNHQVPLSPPCSRSVSCSPDEDSFGGGCDASRKSQYSAHARLVYPASHYPGSGAFSAHDSKRHHDPYIKPDPDRKDRAADMNAQQQQRYQRFGGNQNNNGTDTGSAKVAKLALRAYRDWI